MSFWRSAKNCRKYRITIQVDEVDSPVVKREKLSNHEQAPSKVRRKRVKIEYGHPIEAGLNCFGRSHLAAYLEFIPEPGTEKSKRPTARRLKCKFCGEGRVMYRCSACKEVFCMRPPVNLYMPGTNPQRKFPSNGLFCWQRVHGYTKKTAMQK